MTASQPQPPQRPSTDSSSPLKAVPPSQRAALRQGPTLRADIPTPTNSVNSAPQKTGAPPAVAAVSGVSVASEGMGSPVTAAPVGASTAGETTVGRGHWRRWGLGALAVFGVVAIAQIPTSPWVSTSGEFRLPETPESREPIYAPEGGVIEEIIRSNEKVTKGTPLVKLRFPELEERVTALNTEIARQEMVLQEARSRSQAIQGRVNELRSQLLLMGQQAMRSQDRASRDQSPEVQIYEAERQELRAKQITLKEQAQDTQEIAGDVKLEIEKYEPYVKEGAIPESILISKNAELKRHERDLRSYLNQIQELESRIAGIAAKEEIARQSLGDQSVDRRGEFQQVQAALVAAITEKSASEESVGRAQSLVDRHRQDLNQVLQRIRDNRIIYANKDGRVHSSTDLAVKRNAKVDPKDLLFQIIDAEKLEVSIKVDQADRDVVKTDMQAQIRPVQSDQPAQTVILREDASVMQQDATQQKSQLLYFATIGNPDGSLRPGEKVYVTIATEPMPLYRVVGRELSKVFKTRAIF